MNVINIYGLTLKNKVPNKNETDNPVKIWFLLDSSGSMNWISNNVIEQYNEFIHSQVNDDDTILSLIDFNSYNSFNILHNQMPINKIPTLTCDEYCARGYTPLYDAIGQLIQHIDQDALNNENKYDNLIIIFTDGLENYSKEYNASQISDLIEQRTKDYNWTFTFMGSNQDSYKEGAKIHIHNDSVMNYQCDKNGIKHVFKELKKGVNDYKSKSTDARSSSKNSFFSN